MDLILAIFLCLCVLTLGLPMFFFRQTLTILASSAAEHAKLYATSYCKGGALIAMAMMSTFKETFQPITIEQAQHFAWWDWVIKFQAPILSGLAVLVAFLDTSAQRAREIANLNQPPAQ